MDAYCALLFLFLLPPFSPWSTHTVKALLDLGCDPSATACDGSTPVHAAIRKAGALAAEILATLLDAGASLDCVDAFGAGPAHAACSQGDKARRHAVAACTSGLETPPFHFLLPS